MAKKWIAAATKNKGGLHCALGVPEGKTILKAKIAAVAKGSGKTAKQARLAITFGKMRKKS